LSADALGMTTHWPADRRIGTRYESDRLPISWTLEAAADDSGPTTRPDVAYVVNISATGLGLLGRTRDDLAEGAFVALSWEGGQATGVIRRIEAAEVDRASYYAISIEFMDDDFRDSLNGEIDPHRPKSVRGLRVNW
jgi:hypothetical protein